MKMHPLLFSAPAIGLVSLLVGSPVSASVPPAWTLQIQARSAASGAFNLPSGAQISNSSPRMNDSRNLAFRALLGNGFDAIWYGGSGSGSVVVTAPVFDVIYSDPSINSSNFVVFPSSFDSPNAIRFYNPSNNTSGIYTTLPIGTTTFGAPRLNDAGQVGYRAGFATGQAHHSYDPGAGTAAMHVAEQSVIGTGNIAFLFTPNFNNNRLIASTVRYGSTAGSSPDQVRTWTHTGASTLIAEDRDANIASPFTSFDNSVGINDSNQVAFIATLVGGARSIVVGDGTSLTTYVTTGVSSGLQSISFFHVDLNNAGLVAFRATPTGGTEGVYVSDGTTLRRVVGIGDVVPSDIGNLTITSLSGNVDLNNNGDLAFGVILNSGTFGGIYVATAVPEPGAALSLFGLAGVMLVRRRKCGIAV